MVQDTYHLSWCLIPLKPWSMEKNRYTIADCRRINLVFYQLSDTYYLDDLIRASQETVEKIIEATTCLHNLCLTIMPNICQKVLLMMVLDLSS